MKKILFTLFCLGMLSNITAQENKFKIHSAEVGFGGFYFKKNLSEGGGATFTANLTTSYRKNLFSTSLLTGAEIGIVGSTNYTFNEVSLQYGREIKLKEWIKFELFAGLGYYDQTSDARDVQDGTTISYPLKLNTKFYFNNHFGMGINTNYSINSVNNNFSSNLIFHYRFN
ncbi:hypothetical protein [Flavobacterium sp. J27]|uniref:hypothetical protein n=1 Tax=Flavobacterium sp. J27 TaxID=2060419 RepID=UPI001030E744|nr:hypothetical protein [Flavobacterium sp. J27]